MVLIETLCLGLTRLGFVIRKFFQKYPSFLLSISRLGDGAAILFSRLGLVLALELCVLVLGRIGLGFITPIIN